MIQKRTLLLGLMALCSLSMTENTVSAKQWAWQKPLNKKAGHAFYTGNRNANFQNSRGRGTVTPRVHWNSAPPATVHHPVRQGTVVHAIPNQMQPLAVHAGHAVTVVPQGVIPSHSAVIQAGAIVPHSATHSFGMPRTVRPVPTGVRPVPTGTPDVQYPIRVRQIDRLFYQF